MKEEVKHTLYFSQSPEEVWEYLTKPELLEQWLMPNDFQPIVGHKFQFKISQGKDGKPVHINHYCEVLELVQHKKLSYSWKKDNMPFNSKVTWTLIPKENGTELQLVHNGFTLLEDVIGHDKGWTMLESRLIELLNVDKNDRSSI